MNSCLSHCSDTEYNLLEIFAHYIPPSLVFHCKDFDRAFHIMRSAVIQCIFPFSSQNNDWVGWNLFTTVVSLVITVVSLCRCVVTSSVTKHVQTQRRGYGPVIDILRIEKGDLQLWFR